MTRKCACTYSDELFEQQRMVEVRVDDVRTALHKLTKTHSSRQPTANGRLVTKCVNDNREQNASVLAERRQADLRV